MSLILFSAEGPLLKRVRPDVNIIDLKTKRSIYSVFKISKALRLLGTEVAITALDNASASTLLAKALRLISIPIIASVHAPFISAYHKAGIRSQILKWCIKGLFPYAYAIIAVSHQVKREAAASIGWKSPPIYVIPNPILVEKSSKLKKPAPTHPWFKEAKHVVFACGRLSKEKDFSTLIKAFAILLQQRDARLLIAGEGPQRKELLREIDCLELGEKIQLVGYVEDVKPYFANASCFVLSSRFEGFGNVLVEALDQGCPIVSTRCSSGPIDILHEGLFGELVDVGDIEAMAKSMMTQLDCTISLDNEKKLRKHLRQFHHTEVVKKYSEVIEKAIAKPSA